VLKIQHRAETLKIRAMLTHDLQSCFVDYSSSQFTVLTTHQQRTMVAIPAQILAMIVSPDDMMHQGLELGGFSERQIQNAGLALKYSRFKRHFGSHPVVCAQIWEDLLTTEIVEARILPTDDVE
jgi:hypothetical protein